MSVLARSLHVLAAITWVGGMFFVALVLVPVSRRLGDPGVRARLFHEVGVQFRVIGWISLALLVASGILSLVVRPYLLTMPHFHVKLTLVVIALVLAVVHDFVLGPRAGAPGADPKIRVRATWVARANVLVVLLVVLLGVSLRG